MSKYIIDKKEGYVLLDGAVFPEEHRHHTAEVLGDVFKINKIEYGYHAKVKCDCGAIFIIHTQFLWPEEL